MMSKRGTIVMRFSDVSDSFILDYLANKLSQLSSGGVSQYEIGISIDFTDGDHYSNALPQIAIDDLDFHMSTNYEHIQDDVLKELLQMLSDVAYTNIPKSRALGLVHKMKRQCEKLMSHMAKREYDVNTDPENINHYFHDLQIGYRLRVLGRTTNVSSRTEPVYQFQRYRLSPTVVDKN